MAHRVLHVLGTAQVEATAQVRIIGGLASRLDPRRYRLEACFLGGDGPLAGLLEAAGVPVRIIDWHGARDPVGAWRFHRALRGQDFAVVHQHSGGRSVRWLARRTTRSKLVVHLHGRADESQPAILRPITVRDADLVIAVSHAVARQAVGVTPHVVYPGVEIPDDGGPPPAAPITARMVIGTACRLVPIKGIMYLIRAVHELRGEFPRLCVEIAGTGEEGVMLEREVRMLDMADRVTFLGWCTNLTPVLRRWDVYAQSSLEEGFGVSAVEAMAAGLPVVATAVGGALEVVDDGRTGWLVPPADSRAIADRLRLLLLDLELRRAMGAAGRARARELFSIDRMVSAIAEIYDGLVESGGRYGRAIRT